MATFTYTGTSEGGTAVTETIEAPDRFAVYDIARERGHTVTQVTAAGKFSLGKMLNVDRINQFLSRVKKDDLVLMTRNLASMLAAGLALSRALSVIERQTKNPRLEAITETLREKINTGEQFNVALGEFPKTFDPLYVSMVRAGEESGTLAESLRIIGVQIARSSALQKRIKGAMIYPAIVIAVMGVIGVLMMIYVVPTITATFLKLEVDLPVATQILIGTSTILTEHGLLALAGFIVGVAGLVALARTKPGTRVIQFTILHLPVIGMIAKEVNAARTARTLSSLLSAGVDMVAALKITEDVVQNLYYKDIIHEAVARVEKGEPLSRTFTEHDTLYPVLVGEMMAVGEETGQVSGMLTEVADFYETEVENKTKDLSTIIEPLLMVLIGGVVGFFALAMIAPIYSISESI